MSVVVRRTATEVGAVDSKTFVLATTTLPAESVDEMAIGTNTPVCVVGVEAASGVLTIVLPDRSVVVTGAGVLATVVEASVTTDEVIMLPEPLVVVTGMVVLAGMDESVTSDEEAALAESLVEVDATSDEVAATELELERREDKDVVES